MQTFADALPADRVPPLAEADFEAAFRGAPHRFLDVGHSRLAYWKFGRGPDLVFVHGWPLHAATFRRLLPYLADAFTCHLVDLPGTGQTRSTPGARIDLLAHAVTVRAAIDLLGLSRYAFVAHDVSKLPVAANLRVTEDGVEKTLDKVGLVRTMTKLRGYRQDILDERAGVAVSGVMIEESGAPVMLVVRTKLDAEQKLSQLELVASRRRADGLIFNLQTFVAP
jgi:hypothetical protein